MEPGSQQFENSNSKKYSGMWIFALLILLMMGGGYWNKGNQNGGGEPVTESGLCSAMNFNGLENSVGRLNDSLQAAMCGVVRYPNATTYCSGSNPFGGCGCGAAI